MTKDGKRKKELLIKLDNNGRGVRFKDVNTFKRPHLVYKIV